MSNKKLNNKQDISPKLNIHEKHTVIQSHVKSIPTKIKHVMSQRRIPETNLLISFMVRCGTMSFILRFLSITCVLKPRYFTEMLKRITFFYIIYSLFLQCQIPSLYFFPFPK